MADRPSVDATPAITATIEILVDDGTQDGIRLRLDLTDRTIEQIDRAMRLGGVDAAVAAALVAGILT
jgi:hypothetical protein